MQYMNNEVARKKKHIYNYLTHEFEEREMMRVDIFRGKGC